MRKLIAALYHKLRDLATITLGTRLNETIWRYRHVYKRGWAEGGIKTWSHPHRQLLAQKILAYAPFNNALEIGCIGALAKGHFRRK